MLALVPHTWSPDTIAHMALYRRCPVAYERAMMSQIPYMPKGREPTRAATLLKKVIDRDQQARPSLRDLSLPGAPGACVPCAVAELFLLLFFRSLRDSLSRRSRTCRVDPMCANTAHECRSTHTP